MIEIVVPGLQDSGFGRALLAALALMIPVIALAASAEGAAAKTFTIIVNGDQRAGFVGSCLAKRGDDHEVLALNGKVPFEQEIVAEFVSCRFQATGRISIEATSSSGQHQRVETKSGVVTLSLH